MAGGQKAVPVPLPHSTSFHAPIEQGLGPPGQARLPPRHLAVGSESRSSGAAQSASPGCLGACKAAEELKRNNHFWLSPPRSAKL